MRKLTDLAGQYQFSVVRILSSLYLAYFFISVITQRELIVKLLGDGTGTLQSLALGIPFAALVLCAFYFLGFFVAPISFGLFLCYQMMFVALPVPKEVQASYISLILLLYALFAKNNKHSRLMGTTFGEVSSWHLALFLAVYFGFSVSGLSKLFYQPWLNGEAINYICTTGQIGNLVGSSLCALLPKTLLGFFVLFIEIVALPMAIFKRTRPFAWLLNSSLHIFAPIFLYIWPVSFGVLLMQLVLFDKSWLDRR